MKFLMASRGGWKWTNRHCRCYLTSERSASSQARQNFISIRIDGKGNVLQMNFHVGFDASLGKLPVSCGGLQGTEKGDAGRLDAAPALGIKATFAVQGIALW